MRLYHFILASIYFLGISYGGTPSVFFSPTNHNRAQSEQLGPHESENYSDLERVLTVFLEAVLKHQAMEMYQCLSTEDREAFSPQKWSKYEYYKKLFPYSSDPLALMLRDRVTYEVKEIKIDNNKATAIIEWSRPTLLTMSISDRNIAKEQIIKGKPLSMESDIISYNLIKEQSGWKIPFNLASVARGDSIRALIDEAERLAPPSSRKGDIDFRNVNHEALRAAIDKCETALELDTTSSFARDRLEDYEAQLERLNYRDNVIVQNVSVGEARSGDYAVWGEVKNTGQRTLKEVHITIYFLDKNGNPIYEEDYHPVTTSAYAYEIDQDHLKPNYGKKFGYSADDVPSDWAKQVKVIVTDLHFANEASPIEKKKKNGSVIKYPITGITANIGGSRGRTFVVMDIMVETTLEESRDEMVKKDSQIRDALIFYFRGRTLREIATKEFLLSARDTTRSIINSIIESEPVDTVFFTTFLIQ